MNGAAVSFALSQLQRYRKRDLVRYMIPSLDIAPAGDAISLSTLEGEVIITAGEDTLVMIGPCQDVYPISRQLFQRQYAISTEETAAVAELAERNGWNLKKISSCRLKILSDIYATAVGRDFSVYVREHNATIYGKAGDYYAVSAQNPENPYIIQGDILEKTYEKA
jgi:phosphoglycolate phosphatase